MNYSSKEDVKWLINTFLAPKYVQTEIIFSSQNGYYQETNQ
jgi:hypothetical protein